MGNLPALEVAPAPTPTPPRVYAALLGQTAISGLTYLVAKRAMSVLSPLNLVGTRLVLSASLFVVLLTLSPGPLFPPRKAWLPLALLGLLCGPINQGLFLVGLARSTPAHAALLYALTPIGVYLLELALRRERFQATRFVGIAVAFTGVAVLLTGRGLVAATGPMVGDLLILSAVAAWAVFTTEGKRLTAEHGPVRTVGWSMIAAALWTVPAAPLWLNVPQLRQADAGTWACLAFLVGFTSVLSYLLWYYALSKVKASTAAVFSNLQPVATALAAWAVLGDPLHWELYVGGALVIFGVRLTQRPR